MIGRLLCRLFGHPESEEWNAVDCNGKLIVVGCARCQKILFDALKEET